MGEVSHAGRRTSVEVVNNLRLVFGRNIGCGAVDCASCLTGQSQTEPEVSSIQIIELPVDLFCVAVGHPLHAPSAQGRGSGSATIGECHHHLRCPSDKLRKRNPRYNPRAGSNVSTRNKQIRIGRLSISSESLYRYVILSCQPASPNPTCGRTRMFRFSSVPNRRQEQRPDRYQSDRGVDHRAIRAVTSARSSSSSA
jgi:hypothetical protein